MTTNNSVNLEKSSEMSPIKREYLVSYSKEKLFYQKMEKIQQLNFPWKVLFYLFS